MTLVQTLESLGFVVNQDKSSLVPSQRIIFFGFIIDSVEFKVYLPDKKVQKIISKAKFLISKKNVFIRELASFIGLVINAFFDVFEAKLHYCALKRDKSFALGNTMDFDQTTNLSATSLEELQWWLQNTDVKNG
jgi:hypothetical protein